MPSIKTITPLLGGSYYHIFNRGVNRQLIFYEEKNYYFFLILLKKYLSAYVDILAYCLIPNHFHLVIKLRDEIRFEEKNLGQEERTVLSELNQKKNGSFCITNEAEIGKFISNQFKRLFISYAMAINKQEHRVGALFDAKFKRLEINKNDYLEYVIFYVHYNPEKHGLINDFRKYRYSSYGAIVSEQFTNISRHHVIDIYGSKKEFEDYHNGMHDELDDISLERAIRNRKRTVLSIL